MKLQALKIILALSCILAFSQSKAQEAGDSYFSLNYSMALATGETSDIIGNYNWRGFLMEYTYLSSSNFAIGFQTGLNTLHEESDGKVDAVIESENSRTTITGNQYRTLNAAPFLATFRYVYDNAYVIPYAGAGIGGYYTRRDLEMGLYVVEDEYFQFGLAPHIGVVIPTGGSTSINASVQYNHAFAGKDAPTESYLSFNVGFLWGN